MLQVATASSFAPGGQDLFVFDVAATRGTFPRGVSRLSGTVEWVTKDGQPMLRATERSELLITLPIGQTLPQSFTIEVDLVPRDGGPEPDLRLEGTPVINQDVGSAHLQLTTDASFGTIYIVGGASDIPEFPIPDNVRVTLPETFTRVGVGVEGNTIRFFINGVEVVPDPQQPAKKVQARFARGNVVRITLGGPVDGDANMKPVYLARVRLATGAPATVVTTIAPTTGGTITPMATTQPSAAAPASTGAVASGPVATTNPAAAGSVAPYAAPTPRTLSLTGVTAAGIRLNSPVITTPGYTAAGVYSTVPPRTIVLSGFTNAGEFATARSRSIVLAAISADGITRVVTGPNAVPARTFPLAGFNTTGIFTSAVPRTLVLTGFSAAGTSAVPPRTLTLLAITAAGGVALPPRTLKLAGWTAAGTVKIP